MFNKNIWCSKELLYFLVYYKKNGINKFRETSAYLVLELKIKLFVYTVYRVRKKETSDIVNIHFCVVCLALNSDLDVAFFSNFFSFESCSDRIFTAVSEMASLFPDVSMASS